jgi:hypothetical protein
MVHTCTRCPVHGTSAFLVVWGPFGAAGAGRGVDITQLYTNEATWAQLTSFRILAGCPANSSGLRQLQFSVLRREDKKSERGCDESKDGHVLAGGDAPPYWAAVDKKSSIDRSDDTLDFSRRRCTGQRWKAGPSFSLGNLGDSSLCTLTVLFACWYRVPMPSLP